MANSNVLEMTSKNNRFDALAAATFAEGLVLRNLAFAHAHKGVFVSREKVRAIGLLEEAEDLIGDFADEVRNSSNHLEEKTEVFCINVSSLMRRMWMSEDIHVKASVEGIETMYDRLQPAADEMEQVKRELARLKAKTR